MKRIQVVALGFGLFLAGVAPVAAHTSVIVNRPSMCPTCGPVPTCTPDDPTCDVPVQY